MSDVWNKYNEDMSEVVNDQSWELLPQAWYEDERKSYTVYAIFVVFSLVVSAKYSFSPPVWLSVLGILAYTTGSVFDAITTGLCLRLKNAFDKRGLVFPVHESNPFMPNIFRWKEQLWNPTVIFSVLLLGPLWFMPTLGMAVGMLHAIAGLNNYRMFGRLKLQLWIQDQDSSADDRQLATI